MNCCYTGRGWQRKAPSAAPAGQAQGLQRTAATYAQGWYAVHGPQIFLPWLPLLYLKVAYCRHVYCQLTLLLLWLNANAAVLRK
ncbi:MAG: hypothetical protein EAY75_05795 [Bacteroidetes bacterium]|nr:MAG: hypothetical protein EAY75_05795 [Bacteroidota bacterium]